MRLIGQILAFLPRPKPRTAGLLACLLFGAAPHVAMAQSEACLRLVNELAALDSGGGFRSASPRYQQYERAVRDQQAQITKTRRAAQINGCFGPFGRGRQICVRINASLEQMAANLDDLRRTRDQIAGGSGGYDGPRRAAILGEMERLGCEARSSGRDVYVRREPPRRRTLLEQIFGVRTYGEDGRGGSYDVDPDTGLASRYGTFRTLCVRKCDGYYFPISFATVRERFEQDDQACQSMCPGSDVELYFHGMPGQESEDMISYRSGVPYTELPTAFNYRKKVDPDCSCRFASGQLAEIAGSGNLEEVAPGAEAIASQPRIPLPQFKIDPGFDPETIANMEGGLKREDIVRLGRPAETAGQPGASAAGKIRVVGPEFFPVQ